MRLDSRTARRIATGTLKRMHEDSVTAFQDLAKQPQQRLTLKASAHRKRVESGIRSVLGESFIFGGWHSRTFRFVAFEIQQSSDGKPLQLMIHLRSLNTRSNCEIVNSIAVITMHAMERLMERSYDVDLIRLARKEFDANFMWNVGIKEDGTRFAANEEFQVRTPHGRACGIVSEEGIPIVRTWIHEPGA